MKLAAGVLAGASLLFGCARANTNSVTPGDAAQLIQAALSNDLAYARTGKRKVCVQRELEPPLHDTRSNWRVAGAPSAKEKFQWWVTSKQADPKLTSALDHAFRNAVLGHGTDVPINEVPGDARLLVLFSRGHEPKECDVSNAFSTPNGPFVTYIARPVIADGYAFIEMSGVCGPLCGSGFIQVFQERDGHWIHVATQPTWIA